MQEITNENATEKINEAIENSEKVIILYGNNCENCEYVKKQLSDVPDGVSILYMNQEKNWELDNIYPVLGRMDDYPKVIGESNSATVYSCGRISVEDFLDCF